MNFALKQYATLFALVAVSSVITATLFYRDTETLNPRSIVKVLNAEGTGGGTGFVVRKGRKKVIVTNDHVCAVEKMGYVVIEQDDGGHTLKRILKRNMKRDLCVVDGIDAPALTIADKPAKRFDDVKVLGHPGLRPTAPAFGTYTGGGIITLGLSPEASGNCPVGTETVSSFFGSFCLVDMEIGYTTVPIMPGNSGSPITNTDGEVIGVINSADSTGNQGMFVPLNYLKDMLNE